MIAIAFFAVWSLLGNILSGVLLYFTAPFHVDDTVELLPDQVSGKVLAIDTFFTRLVDENGSHICVPNSIFFQKYIKSTSPVRSEQSEEHEQTNKKS